MIKIELNKETGLAVSPSKNPEYGYINLSSTDVTLDSATNWLRKSKRSCLIKGLVEDLEALALSWKGKQIPGRIAVQEFVANAIPPSFKANLDNKLDLEDAIAPFVKRTAEDGVILKFEDAPIVRFSVYDPTGEMKDSKVEYDNFEEVAEWRAAQKEAAEVLPVGDEAKAATKPAKAEKAK